MSVNEKLTAIADEIRKYASLDGTMSLDRMADTVSLVHERGYSDGEMKGFSDGEIAGYETGYTEGQKVGETIGYERGYTVGCDEGVTVGIEQGKQAEYDAFWDNYQSNGTKTDYTCAFASSGWNDSNFKPKYDIRPVSASRLFSECGVTNLKKALQDAGVVLDLSNTSSMAYLIEAAACNITDFPELNLTSMSHLKYFMNNAKKVENIDKIVLKDDGSQEFSSTSFGAMSALTEIRFEGVIGKTINFQWSPLSKVSIESVVSHLSDSVTGQTVSFKKTAVLAAFGSEENWTAYIAAKPNWNFTLA